jgi:HSP20 family protein
MTELRRWFPFRRNEGVTQNRPEHPLMALNRAFEDLAREPFGGLESWFGDFSPARFMPTIDMADEGKHLKVTAELPGMDANDIEVNVQDGALMLRGEKKIENEDKDEGYYRTERSYGSFQRSVPLPSDVDTDHAEANFDKGVLTVRLPKTQPQQQGKRLQIKSG